jgi:hypothetical protein
MSSWAVLWAYGQTIGQGDYGLSLAYCSNLKLLAKGEKDNTALFLDMKEVPVASYFL